MIIRINKLRLHKYRFLLKVKSLLVEKISFLSNGPVIAITKQKPLMRFFQALLPLSDDNEYQHDDIAADYDSTKKRLIVFRVQKVGHLAQTRAGGFALHRVRFFLCPGYLITEVDNFKLFKSYWLCVVYLEAHDRIIEVEEVKSKVRINLCCVRELVELSNSSVVN